MVNLVIAAGNRVTEMGKIQGAINISLGQLISKARNGDMDNLKGRKICTYCSGGYRGNIAADELQKEGFDTVRPIELLYVCELEL